MLFLLLSFFSSAQILYVEDFSTSQLFQSSAATTSLILNLNSQLLHPPLQVSGYTGGGTKTFDIGNGVHGVFDSTTYSSFSRNGDVTAQVITLDLSVFPELKVTRFNLASGWTLKTTGSGPLVIRSQGDVIVAGTISCAGDKALGSAAGVSYCNGGSGGTGATISVAATSGSLGEVPTGFFTSGGAATGSVGAGGGGGGGFSATGPASQAGSGVGGGSAGTTTTTDGSFSQVGGGAGGGGGATQGGSSGAGGGGGGGRILIYAFSNVTITGSITTKGGAGGDTTTSAGAGGGGSGGSILIFVGNTLSGLGSLLASGGSGGTSSGGGSNGGLGANGRIWGTDKLGGSTGVTTVTPSFSGLVIEGTSQFQTGVFELESQILDLNNFRTVFSSPQKTLVNTSQGTTIVYVQGSRKGFSDETTGYRALEQIADLNQNRYLKFKVSLANNSATIPHELTDFSWTYEPKGADEFKYRAAGCGRISSPPAKGPMNFSDWILFLLVFLGWSLLKRAKRARIKINPS